MTRDDAALARLDACVLDAHASGAGCGVLAGLYREGGELHLKAGRTDAACFALTHAYVYALEAGDAFLSEAVGAVLKAHGRLD